MGKNRNARIDVTRLAASTGIILAHVDLTDWGALGAFFSQFLFARFSVMFFLATIGFYVEKACQAGQNPIIKRVRSLARVYGAWSAVYLALSFVMLVLLQHMPLGQYLLSRVTSFLISGSYYHFWFYPAVIYALLFIGAVKTLLGQRALGFLVPLAAVLYALGLPGTGYLPLGRQLPGLCGLYASAHFETVMHLVCLGFPSVVFGMAAARKDNAPSGGMLLLAAAAYVAESAVLSLLLGWRENPQMLITTPLLTVLFLRWAQTGGFSAGNINPLLFRTVSAGMYNVHPLLLAAFAIVLPGLKGLSAFVLCALCSACFGWALYRLRKHQLIALFL